MIELKKHIYDESNGLWYELVGDYYIPQLTLPTEMQRPIGKWGRMHRDYLKENRPAQYANLILQGDMATYLTDLNDQAQRRLEVIIDQMKAAEGVTEAMKASDQMAWVRAMNSIRNRAEEIILHEMIYREEEKKSLKNCGMAILSQRSMALRRVQNTRSYAVWLTEMKRSSAPL